MRPKKILFKTPCIPYTWSAVSKTCGNRNYYNMHNARISIIKYDNFILLCGPTTTPICAGTRASLARGCAVAKKIQTVMTLSTRLILLLLFATNRAIFVYFDRCVVLMCRSSEFIRQDHTRCK